MLFPISSYKQPFLTSIPHFSFFFFPSTHFNDESALCAGYDTIALRLGVRQLRVRCNADQRGGQTRRGGRVSQEEAADLGLQAGNGGLRGLPVAYDGRRHLQGWKGKGGRKKLGPDRAAL